MLNYFNLAGIFVRTGNGPYWIALRKFDNKWFWPNYKRAVYTNWRPTQPDGCCGTNVTCVLADYANEVGMWDDADCSISSFFGVNFGALCQKSTNQ